MQQVAVDGMLQRRLSALKVRALPPALGLIALCLFASCAVSPVAFGRSVDSSGFLRISGQQFSYQGANVVLRGVNINNEAALYLAHQNYSEAEGLANARSALSSKITEDERDYARLESWGANFVRFGLDWHWFQGDNRAMAYSIMDQHVAWAKAHHLWLIPTMFVPEGGNQDYSDNVRFWGKLTSFNPASMTPQMASLGQFWVEFASRYANEPTIAGYDVLNEPSTTYVDDVWFPYASYLRDQMKTVDANHFFVIEAGA
ncbi:MAG TPA: hypothetical protein DEV93_12570, partial [Chloroflexi bacterium]|nr:hypothetical protein [Chloroflexota bacterium]